MPTSSKPQTDERQAEAARASRGDQADFNPGSGQGSLFEQVRLARLWLPLSIVGVVLIYQLVILPQGSEPFRFWAPVVFYSVLGPLATYITLNWIANEVRQREQAQGDLARLYLELSASHEMLGAIHDVTLRYGAAADLETTMSIAAEGVAEVTGAKAVGLVVGPTELVASYGIDPNGELSADALKRDRRMLAGAINEQGGTDESDLVTASGERFRVLSHALTWGGRSEGSLHAYYAQAPDQRSREAFGILASQFSAAAESTRSRMRDMLTLVEVDRTVRAEGNLERMLVTVLHEMMERVSASAGGVFLADDEQTLRLTASVGLPHGAVPASYRPGESIVGRVAVEREPVVAADLSEDDLKNAGPLLKNAGSAVALPLSADRRLMGVIVLSHPAKDHFAAAAVPYLGLLANQVGLAVRNATAYLQSEELAIVEERSRIAREIHDGVAQMLAFTALKLDLVARLMSRDVSKAEAELDLARSTVRETIRELRRSIFALRPVDLERFGFVETVRRYVVDFGQQNDLRVHLEVETLPELSPKSEGVLFRIFQEAMHNVAKHSQARSVSVKLATDTRGMAYVEVLDDGVGFDTADVADRVTSAGGLGLKQMRERVQARGGLLELTSAPERGTRVRAAVPA